MIKAILAGLLIYSISFIAVFLIVKHLDVSIEVKTNNDIEGLESDK